MLPHAGAESGPVILVDETADAVGLAFVQHGHDIDIEPGSRKLNVHTVGAGDDLSLTARGRGAVGEMTTLLTRAFDRITTDFARARRGDGSASGFGVLLIDEADALAQSRELAQMHHEDRAGVNALLRGIDGMRADRLPVLTVLCTNRLGALDPAVQRRAAVIEVFERPAHAQRAALLARLLTGTKLSAADIEALASATGEAPGRAFGYTYSDLRQRLVPEIVMAAYRQGVAVDAVIAREVLDQTPPTRPFGAEPGR